MGSLQTVRTLWLGLLSTCVILLVVAVRFTPPPTPPNPLMLPVFALVCVGMAVMSFVMPGIARKQALQGVRIETKAETVAEPGGGSEILPAAYRAKTATRIVPADAGTARTHALEAFRTPFILGLALSEAIAMFGLVTRMLGFPLVYALPFFGAGIALVAVRYPTWDRVLAPVERAQNIQIPRP